MPSRRTSSPSTARGTARARAALWSPRTHRSCTRSRAGSRSRRARRVRECRWRGARKRAPGRVHGLRDWVGAQSPTPTSRAWRPGGMLGDRSGCACSSLQRAMSLRHQGTSECPSPCRPGRSGTSPLRTAASSTASDTVSPRSAHRHQTGRRELGSSGTSSAPSQVVSSQCSPAAGPLRPVTSGFTGSLTCCPGSSGTACGSSTPASRAFAGLARSARPRAATTTRWFARASSASYGPASPTSPYSRCG